MKDVFVKNRALIFGLFVLAVLAAVALFFPKPPAPHFSPADFPKVKTFWQGEIRRLGGAAAYREFVSSAKGEDAASAHLTAHLVGGALFEEFGEQGLAVCDASFGYGCYHGFFISAISAEGEVRIKNLFDVCVGAYGALGTGCQHGIGHGIMEYVGAGDINRALSLCASDAPQKTPLLGCTSGVFMEYFWPLGEGIDSLPSARPFDAAHPYAPCPDVLSQFQSSCYFELGSRFVDMSGADYNVLCGGLSGDARRYCFEGAGFEKTSADLASPAAKACVASLTGDDLTDCRAGAAWAEFSTNHSENVRTACTDPSVSREALCLTRADLTEGIDPSFPKPYDEN